METIILRRAAAEDAETIFEWRNAIETRQYFFDPQPLIKENHIKWFEESLKMPKRCILIGEIEKKPIGVLRYDLNEDRAEIDIYLNPSFKGRGFGTKLLSLGSMWMRKNFPHIATLQARVIADNTASVRAFEKAGFKLKVQCFEKNLG